MYVNKAAIIFKIPEGSHLYLTGLWGNLTPNSINEAHSVFLKIWKKSIIPLKSILKHAESIFQFLNNEMFHFKRIKNQ